VELIFFFLLENKTGMMSEVFRTNAVAHRNMTLALIKFYCDIAVTGSSHQFYSKFKYRSYVNKIFTSLWNHAVYRNNIQSYFKTEVFQRFLNMAMGDTTYCFD
jgi:ubiquitin conjugation factor E4 B